MHWMHTTIHSSAHAHGTHKMHQTGDDVCVNPYTQYTTYEAWTGHAHYPLQHWLIPLLAVLYTRRPVATFVAVVYFEIFEEFIRAAQFWLDVTWSVPFKAEFNPLDTSTDIISGSIAIVQGMTLLWLLDVHDTLPLSRPLLTRTGLYVRLLYALSLCVSLFMGAIPGQFETGVCFRVDTTIMLALLAFTLFTTLLTTAMTEWRGKWRWTVTVAVVVALGVAPHVCTWTYTVAATYVGVILVTVVAMPLALAMGATRTAAFANKRML